MTCPVYAVCSSVHRTAYFLQGTRKAQPCLSGQVYIHLSQPRAKRDVSVKAVLSKINFVMIVWLKNNARKGSMFTNVYIKA